MERRRWIGGLASAATIALLAGAWFLLAPTELGGSVSYVIVRGSSMAPELAAGDLVIVRERDTYEIGDVVAYRSSDIKRLVMHRIVRTEEGSYVMKGDSNTWADPSRARPGDVVGERWVRLPLVGRAAAWLRAPRHLALVVAGFLLLAAAGMRAPLVRRSGSRPSQERASAAGWQWPFGGPARATVGALAVLLALFGALAAVALVRPVTKTVPIPDFYEHQGAFTYTAAARKGATYGDGRLQTGDPVFLSLSDALSVRFRYRLAGGEVPSVRGTGGLVAVLTEDSGWAHTVPLAPARPFEGGTFVARGTLDLRRLTRLIERVEQETGVQRPTYKLVLRPEVEIAGTLAGQPIEDRFAPTLTFLLDARELLLEPEGTTVDGAPTNSLTPALAREGTRTENATVAVLGIELGVPAARILGLLGSVVALFGLLLAGRALVRGRHRDEASRIRARYGQWIVPVAGSLQRVPWLTIEVETMESLVRIADRCDRVVLYEKSAGIHTYLVEQDGVVYCYQVAAGEADSAATPPVNGADCGDQAALWFPAEPAPDGTPVEQERA